MPITNLVGPGSNWISVKVWSWRYLYSVTCFKFNKKNIYHWSTLPACAFDNWKWNSLYNFCHQVHGLTFSFTFFSNFTVQLEWVIFKSWPKNPILSTWNWILVQIWDWDLYFLSENGSYKAFENASPYS